MLIDVEMNTIVHGGSREIQTITLSSSGPVQTGGAHYKLYLNHEFPVNNGSCFDWHLSAQEMKYQLQEALKNYFPYIEKPELRVKRTGFGA